MKLHNTTLGVFADIDGRSFPLAEDWDLMIFEKRVTLKFVDSRRKPAESEQLRILQGRIENGSLYL